MIILFGLVDGLEVREEFRCGADMQEWISMQENLVIVRMIDTEPDPIEYER